MLLSGKSLYNIISKKNTSTPDWFMNEPIIFILFIGCIKIEAWFEIERWRVIWLQMGDIAPFQFKRLRIVKKAAPFAVISW